MTHYDRVKRKRLADLLVDEELVTKEVVLAALREQYESKELLSTILLQAESIDTFDLARLVTTQYQVPFIDLEGYSIDKDLVQEFPAELLHRARIIPLDRFGKAICFSCQEIPSPEVHTALLEYADSIYLFSSYARDIVMHLNENHPWAAPVAEERADGDEREPKDLTKDSGWHSLFDTANESVMSEIDED